MDFIGGARRRDGVAAGRSGHASDKHQRDQQNPATVRPQVEVLLINANGDGDPTNDDTDNDGTPDYLDTDN